MGARCLNVHIFTTFYFNIFKIKFPHCIHLILIFIYYAEVHINFSSRYFCSNTNSPIALVVLLFLLFFVILLLILIILHGSYGVFDRIALRVHSRKVL